MYIQLLCTIFKNIYIYIMISIGTDLLIFYKTSSRAPTNTRKIFDNTSPLVTSKLVGSVRKLWEKFSISKKFRKKTRQRISPCYLRLWFHTFPLESIHQNLRVRPLQSPENSSHKTSNCQTSREQQATPPFSPHDILLRSLIANN